MKRILSLLFAVGLVSLPMAASAEPQFVYVRYGSGEPYVFVTTQPLPDKPYPYYVEGPTRTGYYPYSRTWVKRSDGARFDSEVGAMCNLSNTDIVFGEYRTSLAANDRYALAYLANCFKYGPLAGRVIKVVTGYDGSAASSQLATARLEEVIGELQRLGVRTDQLRYSKELRAGWQVDRVELRLLEPMPWAYQTL